MDDDELKSYALRRLFLVLLCVVVLFLGGYFRICKKIPAPYQPTIKEEFSI